MKRTHHCAQLNRSDIGREAALLGWVDSIRDHGGILFVDLRDRRGITQVVFNPADDAGLARRAATLKDESVIGVIGKVVARPEETINRSLPSGEIELVASSLDIFNLAETPPFPLDDAAADKVNEDLRLTYRYLDLRRRRMLGNLETRAKTFRSIRAYFEERDFLDVETPCLFKSTPEGAREYLVPSRLNPGQFYALAQSPQQFKQILMVAGVERYYQIARCFRDEDLRADRQPEFTQLDLEVSFIDREGMYALLEGMLARVWKDVINVELPEKFPRLTYRDAMDRYGVDKPDTRFGLKIRDFSETFRSSGFKVFSSAVETGGVVKAFTAPGLADITQGELNQLTETAKSLGARGLAFIKIEGGEWKSPIVKFFSDAEKETLTKEFGLKDGDLVFFAAAAWEKACAILGRIRLESAELLRRRDKLETDPNPWHFLWVVDFPLMIFDEDEGRYIASHHPFTAPVSEDISLLDSDPGKVRGQHYDLVLNGTELGGGSIRIHQADLQKKVFEDVLKIPADIVESRFGYMLKAFRYGAPPHGGIAFGLDRMTALLCGTTTIRDVIAFPKTQKGQCLVTQSPGPVTPRQLKDLHISTVDVE